jgi:hypothetical protein
MSQPMNLPPIRCLRLATALLFLPLAAMAQSTPAGPSPGFTAITDNIGGAHDAIKINLLRWSTEAERDQLFLAWTKAGTDKPAPGRGGAGRGGAPARRAARDGLKGGDEIGGVQTPQGSLSAALGKVPTVGFLWTSTEVLGYAVHYAGRVAEPDGGERIILITDRRLGSGHSLWKLAGPGPATDYEFSVIELHLSPKGEGEGKVSLTGKVVPDSTTKLLVLENYSGLPVLLGNVKRRIG